MAFFSVVFLGGVAALLATIVFIATFAFIRKPVAGPNRFGVGTETRSADAALISAFQRMLDFSGRANRWDFWTLAICVVTTAVLFIAGAVGALLYLFDGHSMPTIPEQIGVVAVAGISWLLIATACLSMAIRRLHDINRSGWWLLLLLVFGYFILVYWFIQAPTRDADEIAANF